MKDAFSIAGCTLSRTKEGLELVVPYGRVRLSDRVAAELGIALLLAADPVRVAEAAAELDERLAMPLGACFLVKTAERGLLEQALAGAKPQ